MLVSILILYFTSQPHTLNMMTLIQTAPHLPHTMQLVCFIFFFIAFAIKVPVWPFHTWLPDAHVEAPTPISMILAGVLLLGMGAQFLFALNYYVPNTSVYYLPAFVWLAVCVAPALEALLGVLAGELLDQLLHRLRVGLA